MRTASSRRSFLRAAAVIAAGATLSACSPRLPAADQVHGAGHAGAAEVESDGAAAVPAGWIELTAGHIVHAEPLSHPAASRLFAYTAIAMHEAVAAADPAAGSLAGGLTGAPAMPATGEGVRLDSAAAAAAAAHGVLTGLLGPTPTADTTTAIDDLHTEQRDRRAASGVSETVLAASAAHGEQVAAAILDWAADDGYTERTAPYELPTGEGVWELAAPATAPVEPHWGTLRPYALDTADQVQPPVPPAYSADPNSEFAGHARQVYETGRALTDEQRAIAQFWAAGPAARWLTIAADQVTAHHLGLAEGTRTLAVTALALADASIASWAAKYQHNVIRPVTYIQRHIDPAWTPLLPTPGHPEFPAGHSAGAAAAATVLTGLLGDAPVTARDAAGTEPARHLASLDAAVQETAISRVYAGVHYPAGLDAGTDQGNRIGRLVLDRLAPSGGR